MKLIIMTDPSDLKEIARNKKEDRLTPEDFKLAYDLRERADLIQYHSGDLIYAIKDKGTVKH